MVSLYPWPTFASTDAPLATIIKLSRFYGSDPEFVLAGGGNTSVKIGDALFVKGSGSPLAAIDENGFVEMNRAALAAIVDTDMPEEPTAREAAFKEAVMAARRRPELGQRPSVECVLHEIFPTRFVVHTHSTLVNMITCCQRGEELARELFSDQILWMPYVDPGYILARTVADALRAYAARTGRPAPRAIVMQNHGVFIGGDSAEEVRATTDWLIETIRAKVGQAPAGEPFGPVTRLAPDSVRRLVHAIAPTLRGLLAEGDALKVVTFDDSEVALQLAGSAEGAAIVAGGPLSPDQIVYCKSFPLWFEPREGEDAAALAARLGEAVRQHLVTTNFPPKLVLVQGVGLFAAGDDYAGAATVAEVYEDAIKVMAGARRLGGIRHLPKRDREFIDAWEVEAYRRQVAAGAKKPGRAAGKVALVTGAAQGFGLEIAQDLAAQGAHVALADMNAAGAASAAEALTAKHGRGRATGVAVNVTSAPSVADMIDAVVRMYGGLDVLVSNAGVLKAGSVKTLPEKDFDFVTAVNYKGYFLCVQAAAPVMAAQRAARPDAWSDIIQINSKSGLQGSNKNGAYAGSKFGGIGLTQSFAMELVENGIKVNSICPGNFFDGPLWSDPNNGLFVQYLRTGKVPGAKTIEDVKKFYEAKVPMGRGCTTPDVMKAIYYLMEQRYETGQALPVTGGQVMLS